MFNLKGPQGQNPRTTCGPRTTVSETPIYTIYLISVRYVCWKTMSEAGGTALDTFHSEAESLSDPWDLRGSYSV